jgi:hypothetical protein
MKIEFRYLEKLFFCFDSEFGARNMVEKFFVINSMDIQAIMTSFKLNFSIQIKPQKSFLNQQKLSNCNVFIPSVGKARNFFTMPNQICS